MRGGEEFWKLKWLARQVNKHASLDIFKNSRQRDYTEARAVFNFIARQVFLYPFNEIAKFQKINGKSSDHSTIIHSVKNFENYLRFSPRMRNIYHAIDTDAVGKDSKKTKAIYMLNQMSDEAAGVAHEYIKAIYDDEQRMEQMGEQVVQDNMV
jgi:hypothetical protein